MNVVEKFATGVAMEVKGTLKVVSPTHMEITTKKQNRIVVKSIGLQLVNIELFTHGKGRIAQFRSTLDVKSAMKEITRLGAPKPADPFVNIHMIGGHHGIA